MKTWMTKALHAMDRLEKSLRPYLKLLKLNA